MGAERAGEDRVSVTIQQQQAAEGVVGQPGPSVVIFDVRGTLPTRFPGADYSRRPLGGIVGVDLHYTASPSTATVRAIAAYQVGPGAQEDFPAIAYTLIVDGAGVAYWCHDLDRRVWHNGASGHNESHVGICYIGDREPNAAQIRGLKAAIAFCQQQLGRTLTVSGHRDSYSTSCPGPAWPQWRSAVLP